MIGAKNNLKIKEKKTKIKRIHFYNNLKNTNKVITNQYYFMQKHRQMKQ
jgi:hypothetical protein